MDMVRPADLEVIVIVSRRWETGRTEAFSDGVFAIATTLLVLDLAVPESALHNLWHGIADQWPRYLGYATSFLTIGVIWLGHHAIFSRLRYVNDRVMRLNLLLLMAGSCRSRSGSWHRRSATRTPSCSTVSRCS